MTGQYRPQGQFYKQKMPLKLIRFKELLGGLELLIQEKSFSSVKIVRNYCLAPFCFLCSRTATFFDSF